jgi:hypothetical protein
MKKLYPRLCFALLLFTSTLATAQDNIPPTAICKDISIQTNAVGTAAITASQIDNGSHDDESGIASMTVSPNVFDCSNEGPNTVTLTVTDNFGNIDTCSATVIVQDKTPAVAICTNVTAFLDATGGVSVAATDLDGGSTDACGIDSTLSRGLGRAWPNNDGGGSARAAYTCAEIGPNTATLSITDNNGNTSSCNSIVTITDEILPSALCRNTTVTLNSVGFASIIPTDVDDSSFDNCDIQSITVSPNFKA